MGHELTLIEQVFVLSIYSTVGLAFSLIGWAIERFCLTCHGDNYYEREKN